MASTVSLAEELAVQGPTGWRARLRPIARVLPWVVAVGTLFLLFRRTPVTAVLEAASKASPTLLLALVGALALVFLGDAFAMWRIFSRALGALRFKEILSLRGATYLLGALTYSAGQAAIIYFLKTKRQVATGRAAAVVFLASGTNLMALLVLATVGFLAPGQVPSAVGMILGLAWAAVVVYLAVVAVAPKVLRRLPVLPALFDARVGGHLQAIAARLPHVGAIVLSAYVSLHAFGVDIPFGQVMLLAPLVLFVTVVPVSVQGLGPAQALAVVLYSGYAPGATQAEREAVVLASSLVAQTITFAFQAGVGLAFYRYALGGSAATLKPSASYRTGSAVD